MATHRPTHTHGDKCMVEAPRVACYKPKTETRTERERGEREGRERVLHLTNGGERASEGGAG